MPHLLKKLELNGFKSFAGKTSLEFPSGITAVVGPNGSGKSNVVDAIRWLLGERDARNLRGGNVEDLIFAGTPKRPRTGQATASLHFDNSNNFFPVDFAEVVVSRQVTRDGNSRYFLNKSEVLLRDLVDFFAKARLGSRGLVVVTQGNSDMFIKATPSERREMIEEILGLREYQIKKADALRRLKASRINLDRVKALVEELLPHLRSLKRQTARWEKRESLQNELDSLERAFFGSRWKEIQAQMIEIREKITEHEKSRPGLEEELSRSRTHQAEIEASQPKEREELTALKREVADLYQKRGELEKLVGRLEASIEAEVRRAAAASHAIDPEKVVATLRDVKQELHEILHLGEKEMQTAIREVISRIATFLEEKEPRKNSATHEEGEQHRELKRVVEELQKLDGAMSEFRRREEELESGQAAFMEVFKRAVESVDRHRRALEAHEEGGRKLKFEFERQEMRLNELKHQIVQAGHDENKFAHSAPESTDRETPNTLESRMFRIRGELASMGDLDEALVKEARETEERYSYLEREGEDLERAIVDLKDLIQELREKIHGEFAKALGKINGEFEKFFTLMFGAGGHAKLKIETRDKRQAARGEDSDAPPLTEGRVGGEQVDKEEREDEEPGVEIQLSLPKKRLESLEVLSGGEKSLVGIAAIFALISVSPPPFLVLDEIDAPLDERNARRFSEMLKEFSKETQFIVVTHNRATMESADVLYGVTLDEDGTSKVLSLKLEKNEQVAAK